jgi:hypothetical protein
VAEWLRRWTRNPLGSARVGSNPTGVDFRVNTLQAIIPFLTNNLFFRGNMTKFRLPPIAQLVERVTVDRMVPGSIPGRGISFCIRRPEATLICIFY